MTLVKSIKVKFNFFFAWAFVCPTRRWIRRVCYVAAEDNGYEQSHVKLTAYEEVRTSRVIRSGKGLVMESNGRIDFSAPCSG